MLYLLTYKGIKAERLVISNRSGILGIGVHFMSKILSPKPARAQMLPCFTCQTCGEETKLRS